MRMALHEDSKPQARRLEYHACMLLTHAVFATPLRRALLACLALAWCAPLLATERALFMPVLQAKPFGWLDASGRPQGIYPDIAAALSQQTGRVIRVEIVPFARAAALVASGTADTTLMFRTGFT